MFRSSNLFFILLIVLVFATAAFAFAASNTVPVSFAGEGSSVTSGYTVTNVAYTLNATTPSNIASVAFTLNSAAGDVKVRLSTTGSYYNCTNSSGMNWTCTTTGSTVAGSDEFRVVATQ